MARTNLELILDLSLGAFAGGFLYSGVCNFAEYIQTRGLILAQELSKHPNITNETYKCAEQLATNLTRGDFDKGLFYIVAASFVGLESLDFLFDRKN